MNLKKIVLELNTLKCDSVDINAVKQINKIIDDLNEIIINEEHAKTMSAEIPLQKLMNEKFCANPANLALAAGINTETVRRKIRSKDTVLELANGNYVCRTAETVIIKVK